MVVTRFKRGTTFVPSWFRPRQLSCGVRSRLNWGQRPSFVQEAALRCRVKFKLSRVGLTPARRSMRGGQAVLITNARSVASSCSTSPLVFPDSPVSSCINSPAFDLRLRCVYRKPSRVRSRNRSSNPHTVVTERSSFSLHL